MRSSNRISDPYFTPSLAKTICTRPLAQVAAQADPNARKINQAADVRDALRERNGNIIRFLPSHPYHINLANMRAAIDHSSRPITSL
jgi:hypothetical protein